MEKWLNGWSRRDDWVLIGSGLHCVGCGVCFGIICVVIDVNYVFPEKKPNYPFEQPCPLCKLRAERRDELTKPAGSFAEYEKRAKL